MLHPYSRNSASGCRQTQPVASLIDQKLNRICFASSLAVAFLDSLSKQQWTIQRPSTISPSASCRMLSSRLSIDPRQRRLTACHFIVLFAPRLIGRSSLPQKDVVEAFLRCY